MCVLLVDKTLICLHHIDMFETYPTNKRTKVQSKQQGPVPPVLAAVMDAFSRSPPQFQDQS